MCIITARPSVRTEKNGWLSWRASDCGFSLFARNPKGRKKEMWYPAVFRGGGFKKTKEKI
jgi:hypothetical protein